MSQQSIQSIKISGLDQNRRMVTTQRTVTYQSINPTSKSSQSLEPVTYVSPKSKPLVPTCKNGSQVNLTPSSSQLYESQTQMQQYGNATSFQNRQPPSQQSLRNQEFQSFVSNPDNNNTYRRSEMHILTPKEISQNQSFTSAAGFQIHSTVPISQQGYFQTQNSLANGNGNYSTGQQQQVNSVTTYSSVPRPNQQYSSQDIRVVKRQGTGTFLSNTSNLEQSPPDNNQKNSQVSNYRSIQSIQPSQQIQINQVKPQQNMHKFHIPIEKAQLIQQNQQHLVIHTPLQSDRSIPASKPSISKQNFDNKFIYQQDPIVSIERNQKIESNFGYSLQNQISNNEMGAQNKPSSRGESAPAQFKTYSALTSLASSVQNYQMSQNQQLTGSSNEGYMWNNGLNTSIFNVEVKDRDGIEEQIKRGRIESQQQNSVSKNFSPENKRGIQNSAYIDYSYKKSITDKVLAIQVQQTKLKFDEAQLPDIWNKPPLAEKSKEQINNYGYGSFNQHFNAEIGAVSSPQFGSLSIPQQKDEINVSEAPIVTKEKGQTTSLENNKDLQNNLFEQKEDQCERQEPVISLEAKPALQDINIQKIENFENLQTIIPSYEPIQAVKRSSNRSSTVEPIKDKQEETVITPNHLKLLNELRQEQKVRESLFQEKPQKQQEDVNTKILVLDYSNTKETSGSGRSVSSDPYKGFSSFSQKYEGISNQIPSYQSYVDSKLVGTDILKNYLNNGLPSSFVSGGNNQELKDNQLFDAIKVTEEKENIKPIEEETVKKTAKSQQDNTNILMTYASNSTENTNILPNVLLSEPIQVYTTQITSQNYNNNQFGNNEAPNTSNISQNNQNETQNNPIVLNSTLNPFTTNNNFSSANPSYFDTQIIQESSQQNDQPNNILISPTLNNQFTTTNVSYNQTTSQPQADLSNLSTAEYIKQKYAQLVADQRSKSEQPISSYQEEVKKSPEITTTVTTFTTYKQPLISTINNNFNYENTRASQNISSLPPYESYKPGIYNNVKPEPQLQSTQFISTIPTNSSEIYNSNKIDYITTTQQVPQVQNITQIDAILSNQFNSVTSPTFEVTYERQNLHKEKLKSRQNSDENIKKSSKIQDTQQPQIISQNIVGNIANNNSSFGVQKAQQTIEQNTANQTERVGEEKKRLREVKSVDHLLVKRRFVDPQLEEEVKGWVNPIFEEFIKNNFNGNYNERDIQDAIKRSKSEIGFITNKNISPVVIEEQLLQLIEQQKRLIDQQNVQIQLQNEVQKSQLYGNSQISSPQLYANKLSENIMFQNQLNNSHTKSNSQLLGALSSDNHLQYQSNIVQQNASQFNYNSNNPYKNNKDTPLSSHANYQISSVSGGQVIQNISSLSQSSIGNPYSQYPTKIPNPSVAGQDLKYYMNTSNVGSTNNDNHHRIVSYFDQVVEQQNAEHIDYNLTDSGVHEDFNSNNIKIINQAMISPISNSAQTHHFKSVSPSQRIDTTTSPTQPIESKINLSASNKQIQSQTLYQSIQANNQIMKETYSDKSLLENLNIISQNTLQIQGNPLSQINSILNQNTDQLYESTQRLAENKKDTSHIELNNIQPHDDELLLDDLTPFNNYRQKNEREETEVRAENKDQNKFNEDREEGMFSPSKQEISSTKVQQETNSSQGCGTGRSGKTDRQNSKIQHSQSMRTDQGCDENEDDYDQVPKYFSENNSVRDNRESNYSSTQNKQSKFLQNKTEPSDTSSSPMDFSEREEVNDAEDIELVYKQVKKSAKKINKRIINMSNDGRITEESQSNKNDGSQLTSMNINLYKNQQQQDNFVVGEYTPQKNQLNDSNSLSQTQQSGFDSTEQKRIIKEEISQSPSEQVHTQSSVNKEEESSQLLESPKRDDDIKIADMLIESNSQQDESRSSENLKNKTSQQESIPLEQVDEDDQEYQRDGANNNSTKKNLRQNKSDVQITLSAQKRANIPKSSSSLTAQKDQMSKNSSTNDLLKKELRKSETSFSKRDVMASDQIIKSRQSLEKNRKESRESSDSGTLLVLQDIKQHVQDKIKKYDQMKSKTQKSDAILEDLGNIDSANDSLKVEQNDRPLKQRELSKSPQNIFNILSNKSSSLKKKGEKQSPKDISQSQLQKSPQKVDITKSLKVDFNKSKQTFGEQQHTSSQRDEKNKKKSEVLKVSVKSPKILTSSSRSPKDNQNKSIRPKVPHLDKPSSFNLSQSTVRSINQSQIQSPQSETLNSTVRKLQEGSEEFSLAKKNKQTKKRTQEQEQKIFVLHKNKTYEQTPTNNQNTLSRHNTDQPIVIKSSKFKQNTEQDRKQSPSYKVTLSTQVTSERNKISISPSPINKEEQMKYIQKSKQTSPNKTLQVTITSKNQAKDQMNSSVQSNKKFMTSTSLNDNDPNTLNLYQRYQEKKIQEKELVNSQVFQRKKSCASNTNSNPNIHISNISQNPIDQEQQQNNNPSLKSPENIYQQNQNLRYQQQQYLSNQTQQNNQKQQAQQIVNTQSSQGYEKAHLFKSQSELQAYKQKQKEQLENIQNKLQQEEEEYQVLIHSSTQQTVDATISKSTKHLSPTQSEKSTLQHLNKLLVNSPQTKNQNQIAIISEQQVNSQGSQTNNLYSQEGNYTQDYEEYLYQEYMRDQRDQLIQRNIQEGVNSGQLTEDQQKYLQDLDKQENRHKFKEFIKRNIEWVQEKERKIREQQQQKADLEMQECTFKPLINSQNTLEVRPVHVPSTKSSRLLEEQTKQKINSQTNSINQLSQKSFRKSHQASRVGSNAQIGEIESRSHINMNASRKFSNHSNIKLSPKMHQYNTPPSYSNLTQQYERQNLEKQGSAELKQDINDVLGILQSLSNPQL